MDKAAIASSFSPAGMTVRARDVARLALRDPGELAAIAYWYVRRRRVRAIGRLKAAIAALPFIYANWLKDGAMEDWRVLTALSPADRRERTIAVHLHVEPGISSHDLTAAIASVRGQSWPHWTLIITGADDGSFKLPADSRISMVAACESRVAGLVAALRVSGGRYLVPLRADCRLPRQALAAYAAAIGAIGDAVCPIFYGDQDEVSEQGRVGDPWFKPDWDPDMALAQDYVSAACAIPIDAARMVLQEREGSLADEGAIYALLMRLAKDRDVWHLYRTTVTTPPGEWCRPCPGRIAMLRAFLASQGDVGVEEGPFGTARICWPLPIRRPLVSVIVPTRDCVDLLRCCVEGVLERTHYPSIQLIIVDNGSVEEETREFFEHVVADPRVQVLSWPHTYNYSAINNFAAIRATGDYLCLLNNDIEIIDPDWLTEMVRQACRPGVGAVGARLLYPDRTIQHAGIIMGMGNAAGHAHRGIAQDAPGYFANALIARRYAAVTAACLLVSRILFEEVGGLDEEGMRIAYNDVDFCLKLRATGAVNIYAPSAVLIHHESKSRGLDMAPEHKDRYFQELTLLQQRWGTVGFLDAAHHPALDRHSEQFKTT